MRSAAVLFALLAALLVLFNAGMWLYGAPVRINAVQVGAIASYTALSLLLWRRLRFAVILGVLLAALGFLLFSAATYFLWPVVSTQLSTIRGMTAFITTMVAPVLLNLAIAVVLGGVLLSNNRWRGP